MYNNISFIGGIHGVGKSTICDKICNKLKIEYLSASELIKWQEINNDDINNKKVENIYATQDRLINGLKKRVEKEKSYILDGHYCLLNHENEIINVPLDTFKLINPISLNIILDDIINIKTRLEKRDNRPYDQGILSLMQQSELDYARHLSKKLGVTLNIGTQKDLSELLTSLHETFSTR